MQYYQIRVKEYETRGVVYALEMTWGESSVSEAMISVAKRAATKALNRMATGSKTGWRWEVRAEPDNRDGHIGEGPLIATFIVHHGTNKQEGEK